VAVLHHLDGYTQEGIADSLDLSRRTVGKILQRFEEHVKKRAARSGFTESGEAGHG
jgi:DNA-directed RNA polymerase specialized sigma24 family protein